ncbi:MAG TPA: hypothetical protein ENF82_02085 [Candidatus Methanomethylia archaeon]|nr:hypothetical protein [Candidatus Methanomethylicia archaeon]
MHRRGVTPVLGVMFLILITVASTIALYGNVVGMLRLPEDNYMYQLTIEAVELDAAEDRIVIYVKNQGDETAEIDSVYVRTLQGVGYKAYLQNTVRISPRETKKIEAVASNDLKAGEIYIVKVAPSGVALSATALSGTAEWKEYPSNPLLSQGNPPAGWVGTFEPYYPSVIYDSSHFGEDAGDPIGGTGKTYQVTPYYKMWFDTHDGIAFAYSEDGKSWYVVGKITGLTAAEQRHPVVLYDAGGFGGGAKYRIYYWTGALDNSSVKQVDPIGYAESNDGISWFNERMVQQDPKRPLVIKGSSTWWYHVYGASHVIYNASGTNKGASTPNNYSDDNPRTYKFIMFFDVGDVQQPGYTWVYEASALAYSVDGIHWIRYGDQPVLLPTQGKWDSNYAYHAHIVYSDGKYHMWYSGGSGNLHYYDGIGYAYSTDLISWTKDPEPVFHKDDGVQWREDRSYTPWVLHSPTKFDGHGDSYSYKMWFTGKSAAMGYAIGHAYAQEP